MPDPKRSPSIRMIQSLSDDFSASAFQPERPIPQIPTPNKAPLCQKCYCVDLPNLSLVQRAVRPFQTFKSRLIESLGNNRLQRFITEEDNEPHRNIIVIPTKVSGLSISTAPAAPAIKSVNSSATSHSPVLSLGPSSGFYSLVEDNTSIGSMLQSFLELQNTTVQSVDITHMESKYSYGSPLDTISEKYEEIVWQVGWLDFSFFE